MADAKTARYKYVGNPGYLFGFTSGRCVLEPGDVVELTDEEAASVGPDDFQPVKGKPAAPAADPEGDPS